MAALQGIKRRIRSVRSTRQITKAMQLVAASKLRRAQDAALGPTGYTEAARDVVNRLSVTIDTRTSPLFTERPVKRALTIFVGGDRGLAGPYNTNLHKALERRVAGTDARHSVISVGRRAALQVEKLAKVSQLASYDIETADADSAIAQPVLTEAIELFLSGQADAVHLIYTRFYSTIRQEVAVVQLLPVQVSSPDKGEPAETEPGAGTMLDYAARRLLEARLMQAILQARASEQAARMVAMMNAADNAKDLIEDLTLSYNNARQANITQELAEISGGAEAMNE